MDVRTNVLGAVAPTFDRQQAAAIAGDRFGLSVEAEALVSERDQNFRLADERGGAWVLKISNAVEDPAVVDMEVRAVEEVARRDPTLPVAVPRPGLDGQPVVVVPGPSGGEHMVRLLPFLPGQHVEPATLDHRQLDEIGRITARLGRALRGFFHPAAGRVILWDVKRLDLLRGHLDQVAGADQRGLVERALERFDRRVAPALPSLRAQVIHNDLTLDNLLLDGGRVSGILDFGDMTHTALALDLPAMLQSVLRGRDDVFVAAEAAIGGYVSVTPLEAEEAELLADLLAARMVQTVLISVWRIAEFPENAYITGWLEPAYQLLGELEAVGYAEAGRRLAAAAGFGGQVEGVVERRPGRRPSHRSLSERAGEAAQATTLTDELLARRRRVLGPALSPLTYERPLHLVRGEGVWLYDADGRAYLDAYNNVPVVGHAHPRVVEAVARQAALLNTNTRYLHETIVELAERIVAGMPSGLDTVMFVNSGSEANDLAWRLATAATEGTGGIVTAWSYHGGTAAIADLTSSEWPSGERPPHVETIPAPDPYRGPHREAADPDTAYAAELGAAVSRLAKREIRPAALLVDGTFTADGIFPPSAPYLRALAGQARAANFLYVADEVQAGHGRTGEGLWSFGPSGITPDLVTLGKPMGNGHPVAAVVARAEIVERFAADHEFFSTFGGNPVACAAALAVLDVLDEEGLVENARQVGEILANGVRALQPRHPAIGEVRARGLMVGVDLVEDPSSRRPAGPLAGRVKNEMRERGVLVGTTGPAGNVLKIRPPLVITAEEADTVVATLDEALAAAGG